MPATPILDPVTGESLVGTEPQLHQQVAPGWWRQRLNLYTGRTLSVSALNGEQSYRGGLLATMGQSVTAGTVKGLALTVDLNGADPLLVVTPGYGITANGQDVVLNSTLKTRLSTLAVVDAVTGAEKYKFRQLVGDQANSTFAGVLILQPVVAQVSGQVLDTGTPPIEVSGNLGASCDQDPSEYAFEDWQIADAVRLVYLPWPTGVPALPLPAKDPEATWRNRLAYAIFEAESLLGPDDQLPWAMLGLPVALIAFDPGVPWVANTAFAAGQFITDPNGNIQIVKTAGSSGASQPTTWNTVYGGSTTDGGITWTNNGLAWKPLFVDCSAVVRAGGLPRRRYVLPSQPLPLMHWQSNTDFVPGDFIIDANQNIQLVQTGGTSGGPPPQWPTSFGTTITDGTVVWIENGPANWQPNKNFAAGQFIFDSNGNIQHVLTAGVSGNLEPFWNGVFLPTTDGTVTWVNNGSGNPPVIQPALAQARINQLSEQLSQTMAQQQPFNSLADIFPTLPPSGILPAQSMNFPQQRAAWLPRNWSVSAAPVHLEELESVLKTGMTLDLLAAQSSPPEDPTLLEPVEVLVPLPDALYDPDILVHETVAPIFTHEVTKAIEERNLALQQLETAQQQINTLFTAVGPNLPVNPNLIDPNSGLSPDEIAGRNAPPPYLPPSTKSFATVLQSTWVPSTAYSAGQFVVDSNGVLQVVQAAGTSGSQSPGWNTTEGQTTQDGMVWVNRGNATWQPNTSYAVGQLIFDAAGNIQIVQNAGVSGGAAPAWDETVGAQTADPAPPAGQSVAANTVIWENFGRNAWQAGQPFSAGQAIVDANGFIQLAQIGGASGPNMPVWSKIAGATTMDAPLAWINNGPWSWQPNTSYVAGQFVVNPFGFMEVVSTPGTSASSQPNWPSSESTGQITQDGIVWQFGGKQQWRPDIFYSIGQLILDASGNIQIVQTAGISGDSAPAWNQNLGQTTQDSGVTWQNLGHSPWQPSTSYSAGQAILDPNGNIELVSTGGTSGASQPAWVDQQGASTIDASISWKNAGTLNWQPGLGYSAGQIIVDPNGNLQLATVLDANGSPQPVGTAGKSGATAPVWSTTPDGATSDGTITWVLLSYYSTDLLQIKTVAAEAPYTTKFTDSAGTSQTISLLSANDMTTLGSNGLQTLVTSLNARISQANDLLDTAFLTVQTDIYRYRQNVLGATTATALATSPVLANIATGQTASATAENLQTYISTLTPTPSTVTPGFTPAAPSFTPPSILPIKEPVILNANPILFKSQALKVSVKAPTQRSKAVAASLGGIKQIAFSSGTLPSINLNQINQSGIQQASSGVTSSTFKINDTSIIASGIAEKFIGTGPSMTQGGGPVGPAQIVNPGQNVSAIPSDITSQSPLAGAQLNLRTLTIAQRLQQSPSQEAMFYSIGNRLSFLMALQTLMTDLNLVVDDLPIIMDGSPSDSSTSPVAVPTEIHTFSEWRDATLKTAIQTKIQSPYLVTDAPEATFFSVGVRVVEQHTMLLRALEARVQQYSDFVTLCTNALNNIQSNIQQAQTYANQLKNNLLQDRQNVAFTTALLADETNRVQSVNAQRQQVLATSVQLVAYTRARTLEATDTTPSRQLVPANVANPVPACLQQSVSIPPEIREIVGQLREAPVNWMPSVASQVANLERPVLLQQLAISAQLRAAQLMQAPLLPSSAAGESGVYASTISRVYSANQQVFRSLQTQRASFQPAVLTHLSWTSQVTAMQSVVAINDLISAESVHTEISNAVARLIQQISSVATCLYTRVSIALPIDRLEWAEFLRGSGLSVQLQSLAVLPSFNQLSYTDRQQMQMLVDWLFLQIDTSNTAAVAFMSDVVRTAILVASDVPIDNIISGNVIARMQPAVGGVVSLNLPSERISSGMYVNLYSGANLAARAVVSDLDSSTVSATVTDVFSPGTYLETTDTAHFTTLTPQAVALRPLFM